MFRFDRQAIIVGEIYRLDTRDKSRLPLALMHAVAAFASVELPCAELQYRMSPVEGV
jgi:hypothetical protein